jgi:hypothetical protein
MFQAILDNTAGWRACTSSPRLTRVLNDFRNDRGLEGMYLQPLVIGFQAILDTTKARMNYIPNLFRIYFTYIQNIIGINVVYFPHIFRKICGIYVEYSRGASNRFQIYFIYIPNIFLIRASSSPTTPLGGITGHKAYKSLEKFLCDGRQL